MGQGIRYGFAIWAVAMVPLYLTNYTIEPWPGIFVAKILAWELVAVTAMGILIAAMARNDGSEKEPATFTIWRHRGGEPEHNDRKAVN